MPVWGGLPALGFEFMRRFGKRIDGVGGRRSAPRAEMLLPVWITSLAASRTLDLVDVSATGAKLAGTDLPAVGSDLFLRVGPLDTLATVVWNRGSTCGVTFDRPADAVELHQLGDEARSASVTRLTPAERLAAQDWFNGFAR